MQELFMIMNLSYPELEAVVLNKLKCCKKYIFN